MEVCLESTSKIVIIVKDGVEIPARVWESVTAAGVKVQALITRIAAHRDQDLKQFEAELSETRAPSTEVQMFPLRMIL
jgi:hypothetical protein